MWAMAFSVGICTVILQRSLLPITLSVALALTSVGLIIGARIVITGIFLLGLTWGNIVSHYTLEQRFSSSDVGGLKAITGTVTGVPQKRGGVVRFDFHIDRAVTKEGKEFLSGRRVRLRWYEPLETPESGDQWRFKVRLRPPQGYRNTHGFDYEYYLLRSGIHGTGYVLEGARRPESRWTIWGAVDHFRSTFKENLERSAGLANRGILTALAVGERSGIDSSTRKLLRESGLSHLVAISGLHIGLATLFAYGIAVGFWRVFPGVCQRLPAHFAGWVLGVATALGYSFVAGFPISTIRAFVMVCIGGLLVGSCTRTSPENLLAATMFFVSVTWPLSVTSPGFWLSFSAVWLIFRFVPNGRRNLLKDRINDENKFLQRIRSLINYLYALMKLQLVLLVGMLPLLASIFGEIPLSGPVNNLVAVPAFGFCVVPSALAGLGAHLLGYSNLVPWILWPADRLISGILAIAGWFSQISLSTVRVGSVFGAALLVCLGFSFLLKPGAIKLGGALLSLGIFWAGSGLFGGDKLSWGEFNIAMLDVGQGLAVVVTTRQHVLVYDFGPRYGDFSLGEAVVLPHLHGENLGAIDVAVLSHSANDHVGGFAAVADQFAIRQQFSGDPGQVQGVSCHNAPEPAWNWDGVHFTFLRSKPAKSRNVNNLSCVLRIQGDYGSALLTGDLESGAEEVLVSRYGAELATDLLQVPHHGSKTSSSWRFLNATNPSYALLSRGKRNRFGHPSPGVMTRYRREHVDVWDTAEEGQIDFRSTAAGWRVETFSTDSTRFWH